jgi:cold shock CspA family protein/tetratricopeptide (TPR) repeat protein
VIATWQNDWSRAIASFEAALGLAKDESHVHFGFAGLLMRLLENERAAEHFERALALDRSTLVLREAARNEYMRGDFDAAQAFISEAMSLNVREDVDRATLIDVQIQIYVRRLEFLSRAAAGAEAEDVASVLLSYVRELPPGIFDSRMATHLLKVIPSLTALGRAGLSGPSASELLAYVEAEFLSADGGSRHGALVIVGAHRGYLKPEGRKIDYGFVCSDTAQDAFVHVTRVTRDVWDWMVTGGEITFDVGEDERGRWYIYNVARVGGLEEA